jgi:hypothetical protein
LSDFRPERYLENKIMQTSVKLNDHIDYPLLRFLWKWKVSTTSLLKEKFYADSSMAAAYIRLYRLEKAGMIRSHVDPSATHYFWTLDKLGFAAIREELPPLKEEGYLSENMGHDLIASAIHLGDGLFGDIPGVNFFTEQELRRIDPEFYPEGIPTSTRRVPDGYWLIGETTRKIIALEVELTQKRQVLYEGCARFYEDHRKISSVLWVVPRPTLATTIQRVIAYATEGRARHNFLTLRSIYELGWQATVFTGADQGRSIRELLDNSQIRSSEAVFTNIALDTRKSPHKSKHCQIFSPHSLRC